MKKAYTLLLTLCVAVLGYAVEVKTTAYELQEAKAQTTLKAKSAAYAQLQTEKATATVAEKAVVLKQNDLKRQAIRKQVVPTEGIRRVAAEATAETVEIVGAALNYEYYEETGDWFILIESSDNNYLVCFDYVATDFPGTFTVEDLDLDYSYITDYTSGTKEYVTYKSVDLKVEVYDETGVKVNATIVGSDDKTYKVTAVKEPLPEPKNTYTLEYTAGNFQQSSPLFQFSAEQKFESIYTQGTLYTSIMVYFDKEIVGEYGINDIYAYGTYVGYFGDPALGSSDTTFIDPLDIDISIIENTEKGLYECHVELLGSDANLYIIDMSVEKPKPIEPVKTINIFSEDMEAIDYSGFLETIFIKATAKDNESNQYAVNLMLNATEFYTTFSTADILQGSYIALGTDTMSILEGELEMMDWYGSDFLSGYIIDNNKVKYELNFTWVAPDPKATVDITFDKLGESMLYLAGDYYMYNKNDKYIASLDIYTEDPAGDYVKNDFDSYYTYIGLINGTDTAFIDMLDAKATVTKVSDTEYKVEAEVLGSDTILYKIKSSFAYEVEDPFKYDQPSGSVDRIYTGSDKAEFDTDYFEDYGVVYLDIMAADQSDVLGLAFVASELDADITIPEGTYIIGNTGELNTVLASEGVSEDGVSYSFYGTLKGGYISTLYCLVSGTVKVEKIDGKIKITVDALNSNDVPVHIVYDAAATGLDNVLGETDKATKFIGRDGQLYILRNGQKYTVTGIAVE